MHFSLAVLVMFLILIFALGVLIGFSLESLVSDVFPASVSDGFNRINRCTYVVVSRLALPLFGIHSGEQASSQEAEEQGDSLENAIENTKKEMISEMAALETVRAFAVLTPPSLHFSNFDSYACTKRLCEHFATLMTENKE